MLVRYLGKNTDDIKATITKVSIDGKVTGNNVPELHLHFTTFSKQKAINVTLLLNPTCSSALTIFSEPQKVNTFR